MNNKKLFTLLFLSVYLIITAGFHFFHSEISLNRRHSCPACQFQKSSLTTGEIPFFQPPRLFLLNELRTPDVFLLSQSHLDGLSSRDPPPA